MTPIANSCVRDVERSLTNSFVINEAISINIMTVSIDEKYRAYRVADWTEYFAKPFY